VCKNFLPWVLLFLIGYLVFEKTENLSSVTKKYKNSSAGIAKKETRPKPSDKNTEKAVESPVGKNDEEWCEPLPYSDLSQHVSILDFNRWLNRFVEYKCFEEQECVHDPRIKRQLLQKGEQLAKERSKTIL
jgi:hypothetical protein